MRSLIVIYFALIISCDEKEESIVNKPIKNVEIEQVFKDSSSIRAIEVNKDAVFFAGNEGRYGYFPFETDSLGNTAISLKNTGTIDF